MDDVDAGMVVAYYGIDWAAMILTVVAIWLLGNKSRHGFVTMMSGNACWVAVGVLSGSIAMVLANIVFIAMNTRGWLRWAPEATEPDEEPG